MSEDMSEIFQKMNDMLKNNEVPDSIKKVCLIILILMACLLILLRNSQIQKIILMICQILIWILC